ncbi:histidine kinase [Aurantibacillus circumpalustris]|uniref:histidine kinase n=1 Tax=Aurantibacillus circumpalustris TaxID=3036359 RepID=UPI00295B7E24|nr:histidine kinase [Aurantibacillus circumpalustris]
MIKNKNSKKYFAWYLIFVFLIMGFTNFAQSGSKPVARFLFNDGKDYDEVSLKPARLVGAFHTEDRFGNKKNAVRVLGDPYSYINLGKGAVLKQKAGTISLWVLIEDKIWTGQGIRVNPILLTKSRNQDDFFEAYSIYYELDNETFRSNISRDSIRQAATASLSKCQLNSWRHLVLTFDRDFTSFYVDGKLQRKAIKNFETVYLDQDSVLLGSMGNKKNARFAKAVFDDIEFYDRVLTEGEILNLFHAPNPNKYKIVLNWIFLAIAILLVIGCIYLIVRYRLSITLKKEKQRLELHNIVLQTELRVNRALMNPHFVFNSLNALQNFILKNENVKANSYLVKFSKLMRQIIESNMSDAITLEFEIQLLKSYLEIEDLRFEENIKHVIEVESSLVPSSIKIPIMMLQPFVENAVWHGLLKKKGEKLLNISFSIKDDIYILCVIEDNGLGRKKTNYLDLEKNSLATGFIEQRLSLLNQIYNLKCNLIIEDKPNNTGTIIKILIPIIKN